LKRFFFKYIWQIVLIHISFFLPAEVGAQTVVNEELRAEKFVNEVRNAQDVMYEDVLSFYDQSQLNQPSVYVVIEKCRFIDTVFFDEVEYYNPKYQDFEVCLEELISSYADHPDANIYYHYHQYEDSSTIILEEFSISYANGEILKPQLISLVYEDLARHYSNEEQYGKALAFATDAMNENDSLDLSTLKARAYISLDDLDRAEETLIAHLDSTKTDNLYQKGSLFSEIGQYELAVKVFKWLQESEEGWDVSEEIGEALIKLEKFDEARPFLLEASNAYWNNRRALENLFIFDLEHSSIDTVRNSYKLMREEGFWADPFGVFKLKIFFKHGVLDLEFQDLLVILSYVVLFLIIICVPYIWIVPIYAYGRWKYDSIELRDTFDKRWLLKHFWIISSVLLASSFLTEIFIDYPTFVASMNDEYVDYESLDSITLANSMLFFDFMLIIGTFILLKLDDFKNFFSFRDQWLKEVSIGVGGIFVLRFIYGLLFGLSGQATGVIADGSTGLLEQSILALIEHYGSFVAFLSVVIVAPIIEEIQFRGIILGSASRYIPFWAANVLQATLFGLIHENMSLFPFYFCFGLIAGFMRKKTDGYLAPIVFHLVNNLLAFFALLLMT